jgi:hypothetical protein
MADETLSRRMAAAVLTALKGDGHVLVERGGEGAVVRELDGLLAPILPRLVARATRSVVSGEVTSTFGDEATDEAVEELVAELREAIVDNDHVEDVFAEDRELERAIFRALRDGLLDAARSDEAEEEARVPISVRLDTLGYVAATAARRAEVDVVRAALERAARQADGELEQFEPTSRVALFAMATEDPDQRLEVEEAVAEELMSLVTEGAVELPTVDRTVGIGRELNPVEWRAVRPRIDAVAKRLTAATGVPASWRPAGSDSIRLSCTPLSEKDADLIGEIATAFQRDVAAMLGTGDTAPRSVRATTTASQEDPAPPSKRAAREAAPPASKRGGSDAPASRRGGSDAPASKRGGSDAPASKRAGADAPASKRGGSDAPSKRAAPRGAKAAEEKSPPSRKAKAPASKRG